VFPLDTAMLSLSADLAAEPGIELKPFDLAILSAVLTRGSELHAAGNDVSFCTLDGDPQPWDRKGRVYGDFLLNTPARRPNWPSSVPTHPDRDEST
jgi:hypothetical protein